MTFILGLDIGYSNLKLVAGVAGATPRALLRPAGAAPVDRLPEQLGRDDPDTLRVLVDNEPYAAGLDPGRLQDWSRALHADYPVTASYRALYYAALLLSEQEVIGRVVTGLPVDQYLCELSALSLG